MATLQPLHVPAETDEGVLAPLRRLIRLEIELALAEARDLLVGAATAIALGVVGALLIIGALVVMLAAALAPLFAAPWQHLAIAAGISIIVGAVAVAWTAWRFTNLKWPEVTLTSLEETWRWLEAQLRFRLRLR
jgi:Putative Actinobacterial Holin-X, holin superfamily III